MAGRPGPTYKELMEMARKYQVRLSPSGPSEALLEGLSEESQQPQLSDWDMAAQEGKLAREPGIPPGWEKGSSRRRWFSRFDLPRIVGHPFVWDDGGSGVHLVIKRWLDDVEVTVTVNAVPPAAQRRATWLVSITPIRGDTVFLDLSPSLSATEALQQGAQQAETYGRRGAVEE